MINTINLQTTVGRRKGEMKKYQNSEHLQFCSIFFVLHNSSYLIYKRLQTHPNIGTQSHIQNFTKEST